mmetsp:Transcript_29030/g.79404  ORF Transcript_29030/g.79404 Transcript_29030/m.79404 type:complete len:241 (+) Transcript_29030:29-751(+)
MFLAEQQVASYASLRRQLGELTEQFGSATLRVHELEAENRTLNGVIEELQAALTISSEALLRLNCENNHHGSQGADAEHNQKTMDAPNYNDHARERFRRVEAKLQNHRAATRQLKILHTSRATQLADWFHSEVHCDGTTQFQWFAQDGRLRGRTGDNSETSAALEAKARAFALELALHNQYLCKSKTKVMALRTECQMLHGRLCKGISSESTSSGSNGLLHLLEDAHSLYVCEQQESALC